MNNQKTKTKISQLVSGEAGDVPGWVLITLMTAGLVVVLWSAAGPALNGVLSSAIQKVSAV